MTSVENYKDKFERLYALLKSSPSEVSAKTVFGEQAASLTRDQPERVQYFVGNSKGSEKKEMPAKNRKSIAFTTSKCGRSAKCKKTMKPVVKVKSPRNSSLERNIGNLYQPCSLLTELEKTKTSTHANFEPSTDEKAYSCSILLKNLALQVQPPEKRKDIADEIAGNRTVSPMDGIFTQCDISKDSSMKSLNVKKSISTKKLSMETLKFSMTQCDQTEFLSIGKIDKIQSKAKNEQGAKSVLHNNSMHIKNKGSTPELNLETRDAILESQKTSPNVQNLTQPFPEITDIRIHPPVHEISDGLDTRENPNTGDDMDFVIDALGPNILTGNDDDILNNWLQMLEKDEETEKRSSTVEATMDVNLDQFRSGASVPAVNEEAMDTDESDNKVVMSSMKSHGISRKRMSYPLETHPIPEKTICPDRDQILPNFEKILR